MLEEPKYILLQLGAFDLVGAGVVIQKELQDVHRMGPLTQYTYQVQLLRTVQ